MGVIGSNKIVPSKAKIFIADIQDRKLLPYLGNGCVVDTMNIMYIVYHRHKLGAELFLAETQEKFEDLCQVFARHVRRYMEDDLRCPPSKFSNI